MKSLSAAVLAVCLVSTGAAQPSTRVTGPYTFENLSLYLIHGQSHANRKLLTLEEALQQHKIIVYETRNVNELTIENISHEEIYIQSGDIVKGGAQDRTFKDDLIVPSNSGRLPIDAFCVEHGRWSRRGQESASHFEVSQAAVPSRQLKMAIRSESNQSEVWKQVGAAQSKLADAVGAPVASPQSPSSLQLVLENDRVRKSANAYVRAFSQVLDGKPDVVGYAFAINGKIDSADVYASADLFRKLWPKLLNASAIAALADTRAAVKAAPPKPEAVRATLLDAGSAPASERDVTRRIRLITRESDKTLLYQTQDRDGKEAPIHSSYVSK